MTDVRYGFNAEWKLNHQHGALAALGSSWKYDSSLIAKWGALSYMSSNRLMSPQVGTYAEG